MEKETVEVPRALLKRIYNRLAPSNIVHAVYIPPAQAMRNAADEIERKDADNALLREILED